MNLEEVRRLVCQSTREDWYAVPMLGAGGPTYVDALLVVRGNAVGVNQRWIDVESHHSRATYRADVSLGVAWGMAWPNDKRDFDWLKAFDDSTAYPTIGDILWNGALVERFFGLVVDGGNAVLPYPRAADGGAEEGANEVTQDGIAFWQLIAEITGHQDFRGHLELADFSVVDTDGGAGPSA
jgi:hypothetical protein